VTTVSCLLFAKLVGPPFVKFVSLNYMKSGWFKDAIQLMTIGLTVCVLQRKIICIRCSYGVGCFVNDFWPYPRMSMSMSKWIHLAQLHAKRLNVLSALVSREQDRLQCAPKDTVAHSRFTQFDRQCIPDGRTPDREGLPTECAMSIPRNNQAVQVGWSSISTGDVGDWSAAVDQIFWCSILHADTGGPWQPACTPERNVTVELVVI